MTCSCSCARRRRARIKARITSPLTDLDRKQDRAPVPTDWTYAPAPESRDIVKLAERYGHFIGGEWVEATSTYETISPRDEEVLAAVPQGAPQDVHAPRDAPRAPFSHG